MLLTFIFMTQMLVAQNDRRPLPAGQLLPRTAPISNNDPGLLRAACLYSSYETAPCVEQYKKDNAFFNESSLEICKSASFMLISDKKKCVDQTNGKIFNISNLNTCLDKGHNGNRRMMPAKIEVYMECMKDVKNHVGKAGGTGSGAR